MNFIKVIISILILVASHSISWSQIITERPDQTESSYVVGSNNLQIESGILVTYTGEKNFL